MRKMQLIGLQYEKLKHELDCQVKKMHFVRLENEKMKHDLESQRKELERQAKELEKREAQDNLERKNLLVEKEKVRIILYFSFVVIVGIFLKCKNPLVHCFSWKIFIFNWINSQVTPYLCKESG